MWRRSWLPSKLMPNISQASRSCHAAPAKVRVHVPMRGSSSGTSALSSTRRSVPGLGHRRQHLDAGVAAGVARGRAAERSGIGGGNGTSTLGVLVAPVGRGQPVDGRQEVEERGSRPARRRPPPRWPTPRWRRGSRGPARAGCSWSTQRVAEVLGERGEQRLAALVGGASGASSAAASARPSRWRCRQPTTIGSPRVSPFQRLAMSSFWMRSCSSTMPSSSASGRGGQPGT